MSKKKHIDDVQPATVDEHLHLLVHDETIIDYPEHEITPADLPEWFDADSFKKGQAFYMRNLAGMGAAGIAGLIAILSVPETLDVLIFTKQSSSSCMAYRRYAQTMLHAIEMYKSDVTDPNSKLYKSLNVVRWKHSSASKRAKRAGIAGIYQRDMAITQFGFFGFSLIVPDKINLRSTPAEIEAFVHFWRVLGHLVGVSDRVNICRKTVAETIELCDRLMKEVLREHVVNSEPRFLDLINHTLNGLSYADISIHPDAVLHLTYYLMDIEYTKPLGWWPRTLIWYRESLIYIGKQPIIAEILRVFFNCQIRVMYWLVEYFPIYGWLFLGRKNTKICLYPTLK